MLRRSMHAWRSTSWLLHTRAVLCCCCCCKSCWCQSSLAPLTTFVTYFYFPAPPQSGPGAMLVDGVTTKPRLKQAGREGSTDDTPRVRGWQGAICSWQVAATHSHNLSGSLLATRFFFYFSPTYHTSAAAACIVDTEQPDLPLWKSTKPEAVPVHSRSRWTLRRANEPWNNPFVMLNTLTLGVEVPTPDHLRVFWAKSGEVESGANLSFPVEEDRNRREDCKMFSNFVVEIIVSLWSQKLVSTRHSCVEYVKIAHFETNLSSCWALKIIMDMCHGTIDSFVIP